MDDVLLTQRLRALEAQVKLLSDHLGVTCPPFVGATGAMDETGNAEPSPAAGQLPNEVLELARAGKTTQAISAYRRLTGASLLEAKTIVDRL